MHVTGLRCYVGVVRNIIHARHEKDKAERGCGACLMQTPSFKEEAGGSERESDFLKATQLLKRQSWDESTDPMAPGSDAFPPHHAVTVPRGQTWSSPQRCWEGNSLFLECYFLGNVLNALSTLVHFILPMHLPESHHQEATFTPRERLPTGL